MRTKRLSIALRAVARREQEKVPYTREGKIDGVRDDGFVVVDMGDTSKIVRPLNDRPLSPDGTMRVAKTQNGGMVGH